MRRARAIASENRDAILALLLIAAVFAVYAPALGGDRVWDDDAHITVGALQGLDGLRRIWFEPGATQQYYPVLHSAFWLEHRLWGEALPGYHAVTVLLHALAALLLVLLGQRAGVRGAWIGAYLFALHPVNAESVAWISEQKNTLSLVFALLASLVWLQYDASRLRRHWVAALALFLLALGSKTVTATLPAVLLVLTWWRRGRSEWRRDVVPLLPWLAVGVAAGLGTAWIERHVIGAVGAEFVLSPLQRLLLAGRASWHYLTTFLWPTALVFMYPRWVIDARDPVAYLYPASYLALLAACWRARHASRAPLAALLAFTGMLFPVLGFLDVYPFRYSFVADHFQYQATIPLAMLAGAAISWTYERAAAAAGSRAGAAVAEGAAGAAAPRLLALAVGAAFLRWRFHLVDTSIAVDSRDHIWVLQRPRSLTEDEAGATLDPPQSKCCRPAPPVLEFDAAGNLLRSWGGPGTGYDWPGNEHGIHVDAKGFVWVTGEPFTWQKWESGQPSDTSAAAPPAMQAAALDASNHLVLQSTDAYTGILIGGSNPSLKKCRAWKKVNCV